MWPFNEVLFVKVRDSLWCSGLNHCCLASRGTRVIAARECTCPFPSCAEPLCCPVPRPWGRQTALLQQDLSSKVGAAGAAALKHSPFPRARSIHSPEHHHCMVAGKLCIMNITKEMGCKSMEADGLGMAAQLLPGLSPHFQFLLPGYGMFIGPGSAWAAYGTHDCSHSARCFSPLGNWLPFPSLVLSKNSSARKLLGRDGLRGAWAFEISW